MARAKKTAPAEAAPEKNKKTVPAANLPAKVGQSNVPAELAGMMKADKGKGVSTDQSDNLVPLIYILQDLSSATKKRDPAYIEGAEAGKFWLRNAPEPIVSGEEGLLVQPCFFTKDFVEWRPRADGGGFIGRHAEMPDDVTEVRDPKNKNKVTYVRKNGNEVIETRSHVVRVFTKNGVVPYVLPFSSTGHTTSRTWMFMMNGHEGAPSFSRKYRLTTREKTNAAGTWFGVDVKDEGWVTPEEYMAGRTLYEAFASGDKQAEAPVEKDPNAVGDDAL